jgi:hypothetical protein
MIDTYILPEREENDELDADDFEERLVLGQVCLELEIELDETVHGDCDRCSFKAQYPNVSKGWAERRLAVTVQKLGEHGHEGKNYADETVLVDTHVYDLCDSQLGSAIALLPTLRRVRLRRYSYSTYIKPCQPTPRNPKYPLLGTASAFLNPRYRPDPIAWCYPPKVVLLLLQCRLQVMT